MIDFLKKYKEQIFNIITIFLILEFVIYPGLTTANTFYNIMAGIGFLLLIIWGGLALYNYVVTSNKTTKEIGETELDYIPKPKAKSAKKKAVTKKTK